MRKLGLIWVSVVMVVMAGLVWSGCESAGGTGGIGLSPSSVTLGGASNATEAVVFAAQPSGALALPLEWRVSNPALGTIISQSGSNATYKANAGRTGDNIITVRDQYQNEGSAVITQQ